MISYLLAGPGEEPVSLADARAFLRLDDTAEDGLVTTLIAAARMHVEGVTGRALLAQSWRVVLDDWPDDGVVTLPVGPLMSVTTITAYDLDDDPTDIALGQVVAESGPIPARIILPRVVSGAPALRARLGVEIDYVAGYGETASAVPADLKHALLTLVAHWFEHRDAVIVAGSGAVVPAGFDRLVGNYRQVRL